MLRTNRIEECMDISILLWSCGHQPRIAYTLIGPRVRHTVPSLASNPMGGSLVFGLLTSANSRPAFQVPASRICARVKGVLRLKRTSPAIITPRPCWFRERGYQWLLLYKHAIQRSHRYLVEREESLQLLVDRGGAHSRDTRLSLDLPILVLKLKGRYRPRDPLASDTHIRWRTIPIFRESCKKIFPFNCNIGIFENLKKGITEPLRELMKWNKRL